MEDGSIQKTITLFGSTIWMSLHNDKFSWFRLFGRGLKCKHSSVGLLFSERMGYKKYVKIGEWVIGFLPYNKYTI